MPPLYGNPVRSAPPPRPAPARPPTSTRTGNNPRGVAINPPPAPPRGAVTQSFHPAPRSAPAAAHSPHMNAQEGGRSAVTARLAQALALRGVTPQDKILHGGLNDSTIAARWVANNTTQGILQMLGGLGKLAPSTPIIIPRQSQPIDPNVPNANGGAYGMRSVQPYDSLPSQRPAGMANPSTGQYPTMQGIPLAPVVPPQGLRGLQGARGLRRGDRQPRWQGSQPGWRPPQQV